MRTLYALGTLWSLWACYTLRPCFTLWTLWSLWTCYTLHPCFTLWTLWSLWTHWADLVPLDGDVIPITP